MLDRIDNWNAYLSNSEMKNDKDLIELHIRTGRPLACSEFIHKLEVITGEELAPRRPGRKPVTRK